MVRDVLGDLRNQLATAFAAESRLPFIRDPRPWEVHQSPERPPGRTPQLLDPRVQDGVEPGVRGRLPQFAMPCAEPRIEDNPGWRMTLDDQLLEDEVIIPSRADVQADWRRHRGEQLELRAHDLYSGDTLW
jgi:hypothetical protein